MNKSPIDYKTPNSVNSHKILPRTCFIVPPEAIRPVLQRTKQRIWSAPGPFPYILLWKQRLLSSLIGHLIQTKNPVRFIFTKYNPKKKRKKTHSLTLSHLHHHHYLLLVIIDSLIHYRSSLNLSLYVFTSISRKTEFLAMHAWMLRLDSLQLSFRGLLSSHSSALQRHVRFRP